MITVKQSLKLQNCGQDKLHKFTSVENYIHISGTGVRLLRQLTWYKPNDDPLGPGEIHAASSSW